MGARHGRLCALQRERGAMNGLPSYDYERDDARANEADSINASRAADAHFTCGHCHQLARFSELTGLSICCGWGRAQAAGAPVPALYDQPLTAAQVHELHARVVDANNGGMDLSQRDELDIEAALAMLVRYMDRPECGR